MDRLIQGAIRGKPVIHIELETPGDDVVGHASRRSGDRHHLFEHEVLDHTGLRFHAVHLGQERPGPGYGIDAEPWACRVGGLTLEYDRRIDRTLTPDMQLAIGGFEHDACLG